MTSDSSARFSVRLAYLAPRLFFGIFLLLGLWLVPDYGMSTDEAVQRKHSRVTIDYIMDKIGADWERLQPVKNPERHIGHHYGMLYSVFCSVLELRFGIHDFRSVYLLRHTVVFLLFWLAAIFFYKTMLWRFGDWRWGLLGAGLLILCPRIFANAFYNPKDIVLLSGYVISTYTLIRFVAEPGLRWAVWHGLATAVVINTRIVGIIIPAITLLFILLDLLQHRFRRRAAAKYAFSLPLYLLTASLLTVLFAPYLWRDAGSRFTKGIQAMAHYQWGSSNLHYGVFIPGDEVPWHYIPDWLLLTIPLLTLLLFAGGVIYVSWQTLSNLVKGRFWNTEHQMADLLQAGLFFGPLVAVIILQSTLYNGWRQLYFIYPPMAAMGMLPVVWTWQRLRGTVLRYYAVLLLLAGLASITWKMAEMHPHENVYFNSLAKGDLTYQFDMDYWGLAYKQALEELARRDTSQTPIAINCASYSCQENYRFLPKSYRDQFHLKWKLEYADYFLSNFRRPKLYHKFVSGEYPYNRPVFFIEADGHKIIGVYDLRPEE